MDFFESLTNKQRGLFVALPYRVGLWVSRSDESGADSEALEMQTLEALLTGYSEDCCQSELVDVVLKGTIERKAEWGSWQDKLDDVPAECREALSLLDSHIAPALVMSFKAALMDIALNVATAYNEQNDESSLGEKMTLYSRYCKERVSAFIEKRMPMTLEHMASISQKEQGVLAELSRVLNVDISQAA